MKLQRVERHIFVKHKKFDELTYLSKNLYNYANYVLRQSFIKTGKLPSEYDLTAKWNAKHRGQVDFLAMPSAKVAQQVVKLLFKNWKSFFEANKEYKKNPSKFKARPKLPKYKDSKKGRNIVIFTAQNAKLKNGYIHFPKKAGIDPIKTKVSNLKQVRIVPQATCFIVEIVYEIEKKQVDLVNDTWLSIDLGLNNLVTTFNNIGEKPFIINGKVVKSINQYYNKQKAKFMSFVGDRGNSNRINKLTHKRNMKINDYFHKTSRYIVDYCIEHKIEKIIIGDNKDWKQSIFIGKKNNQNFVSIPHAKLIQQIQYKAEEVGIEVILTEESYTSKTDHFALEPMKKYGCDKIPKPSLGKRVKRGLFRSSTGRLINADVNGAIGIALKVAPQSSITELLRSRGIATTPSIVRCF
jgi:putative transposase